VPAPVTCWGAWGRRNGIASRGLRLAGVGGADGLGTETETETGSGSRNPIRNRIRIGNRNRELRKGLLSQSAPLAVRAD